jgi:hypothetical protein
MFKKVICFAVVLLMSGAVFGAPGDIAGLEAWFDGRTITEGDGVNIATWADSSDNNRGATTGLSSFIHTQPDAGTGTIGTLAGSRFADFDGSTDALEISNWNQSTGPYTILVLARTTDGRGYLVGNDIGGRNPGDGAFGFGDTHDHPAVPNATGEVALANDSGSGDFELVASGNASDADGNWHIYAVIVEDDPGEGLGANVMLSVDGVAYPTGTVSGDGTFNTTNHPVTIGGNWGVGGANMLDGDFAQVLIYSGALSADDFNAVGFFIEQTYGLDTAFEAGAQPVFTPFGGTTTAVAEGGAGDTIGVSLGEQPAGAVVVEVQEAGVPDISDPNILVYDITLDAQAVGAAVTLNFDTGNWDTPQTIAVAAFDDSEVEADIENIILNATVTSPTDPNDAFTGATGSAIVNVSDDDGNKLEIAPLNVSVTESGVTGQYDISLTLAPTSEVQIAFTDDAGVDQVTVSPNPMIFGIGETGPKTATVTAIDDGDPEAEPHQTTISHAASQPGGDQAYDGKAGPAVTATIGENDCGPENGGFNISDFNEDCLVNLVDFATFGLQWMECSIGNCN